MSSLTDFLAGNARNRHVMFDGGTTYVRRSKRSFGSGLEDCYDIATIQCVKDNTGAASRFIAQVEDAAIRDQRCVFVESVVSKKLKEMLERRGYKPKPTEKCSYFRRFYPLQEKTSPADVRMASLVFHQVSRVLGGRPRDLREEHLHALPSAALRQLHEAFARAEDKASMTPSKMANLIASGRYGKF